MPEITTFTKFKDWLLLALFAGTLSLLGALHASAAHRIEILEARMDERGERLESHAARLATIEAIQVSQRDETFRRLDRIERKIDVIRAE